VGLLLDSAKREAGKPAAGKLYNQKLRQAGDTQKNKKGPGREEGGTWRDGKERGGMEIQGAYY